jgi:outer membrane protein assembly factor BamB
MSLRILLLAFALSVFTPLAFTPPAFAAEWPSFRGPAAAGIAEGQQLPGSWDATTGTNIQWKTAIPGLAHSSPILWGDRVFVTTAISSRGNATFKTGLYGEGTASEDLSSHKWQVIALDRISGKILWTRTAHEGPPKEKRHIKSTYASSSPATNGRVVVALFGSQGLYAYDFDGKLLWKKDLGRIDAGAYNDAGYEWGTASSPVIYGNSVIVQCDQQKNSFLLAVDLDSGETLWKAERDELPSWASPNVYTSAERDELVTNAPNRIRGYDPKTGKELWRLGGSSKITAPTPIFSSGLMYVTSGRRPEAPIFAIRPGANGDITLGPEQDQSKSVAWHRTQRGSYMPTPLLFDGLLYVLGNAGIFDCYDAVSGDEVYRERISHGGSGFSASPVAADGKIYLSSEDGEIAVVRAGRKFELLGRNPVGEPLMATPALGGGRMYVRGEKHLFAIGR